jgi:chromosome segregation ATPase
VGDAAPAELAELPMLAESAAQPGGTVEADVEALGRALSREREVSKGLRREAWQLAQQLRAARERIQELEAQTSRDWAADARALVDQLTAARDDLQRLLNRDEPQEVVP